MDTLQALMTSHPGVEAVVKFGVAVVLGGAMGYERQRKGEAAGLRTHILVCLGATLLMIISDRFAMEWATSHAPVWLDRGRIAAGIIMGVGFLGAGAILHYGREQHGLTTAATIWFVAALGVAIGAGYFVVSVLATVLALAVVAGLGMLEQYIPSRGYATVELRVKRADADVEAIKNTIGAMGRFHVVASRVRCSCHEEEVELSFRIEARPASEFDGLAKKLHESFPSASLVLLERQN